MLFSVSTQHPLLQSERIAVKSFPIIFSSEYFVTQVASDNIWYGGITSAEFIEVVVEIRNEFKLRYTWKLISQLILI
jgi:hypothetical protein